jgi:aspartyl-tRNA(Asn)/glutamyl-tRNA(Gln) amidotransferase subunit C
VRYAAAVIEKGLVFSMDLEMVKYLAELGKLEFTDEALAKTADEMTDIIELMDTIKDFGLEYDALKDNHNVFLNDLRKDEKLPSMSTEKVLQNAVNSDNCFVVPKVVE